MATGYYAKLGSSINWMFGSVPHRLFMHCIPKAAGYFIGFFFVFDIKVFQIKFS